MGPRRTHSGKFPNRADTNVLLVRFALDYGDRTILSQDKIDSLILCPWGELDVEALLPVDLCYALLKAYSIKCSPNTHILHGFLKLSFNTLSCSFFCCLHFDDLRSISRSSCEPNNECTSQECNDWGPPTPDAN